MWTWILLVLLVVSASTLFWEFYWVPSRPRKFVDLAIGTRFSFLDIHNNTKRQVYVVLSTEGSGSIQTRECFNSGWLVEGTYCVSWSPKNLSGVYVKVVR